MVLNLRRSGDGADSLVPFVPHFNDDVVGLAFCELVAANLTRREDSSLHSCVQAGELVALVIRDELDPIMDVEIVSGHTNHRRGIVSQPSETAAQLLVPSRQPPRIMERQKTA